MAIVAESRALAAELGVLDSSVFFNSSWVDYADRQNYLTEADAGVSTHYSHIETTFSFRTRILDYLWAELPMVVSAGDHFAEMIATEKLGLVVDPEDVAGLSRALERILFDEKLIALSKKNIRRVRSEFYWEKTLAPLVDFVSHARHASDHPQFTPHGQIHERTRTRVKKSGVRHDLELVYFYLKSGGPRMVLRKVRNRLTRSAS